MPITLERGRKTLEHFPDSAHGQRFGIGFSKVCPTDNRWAEILLPRGVQRLNQVNNIASYSTLFRSWYPSVYSRLWEVLKGRNPMNFNSVFPNLLAHWTMSSSCNTLGHAAHNMLCLLFVLFVFGLTGFKNLFIVQVLPVHCRNWKYANRQAGREDWGWLPWAFWIRWARVWVVAFLCEREFCCHRSQSVPGTMFSFMAPDSM